MPCVVAVAVGIVLVILFNYFINFYSLTNVITKFSKDKEQVHRILASTNAYKPSVFNKQWQGQIEWINNEELKTETFGSKTTICLTKLKK